MGECVWSAPDGSYTKTIVRDGSGIDRPNEGANCHIRINSDIPDSGLLGYKTNEDTRIMLGNGTGDLSRVVDGVLETMRKGESCNVGISCEVIAALRTTAPKDTGVNSEMDTKYSFDLTLLDFERTKEVHQMTLKEKAVRMRNYKSFGSECFKSEKYDMAESFYIRGLKYAIISERFIDGDEFPEVVEKFWDLKKLCLLNLAACHLRSERYKDVIINCTKAIEIDDTNPKGYYRRGQAHMALQDYELAMADFRKGLELEPQSRQLHDQMKILKMKMRTVDEEYGKSMRKFFD